MRRARNNLIFCGAIVLAMLALAIGCSGGGDSTAPHFNDTSGTPGVQGNVGDPVSNPGTSFEIPGLPVVGASDNAPLGTNPAYTTQPISNLITTTRIEDSGTSSLRTTSSDDRVLWVAVAKRGELPIPGTDAPPISEGDLIDLYIRYEVFQGELNISRQWILEAGGLNFVEPSVSHPEPGIYQAVFPFVLPFNSEIDGAVFKGVIGPARTGSLVVVVGFNDFREVLFDIIDTPTLPPIHYPDANPDAENDTIDHSKGCLPEYIYVEFFGSYITVESDKAPSNVRILTESGEFYLFENLPEDTFQVFESPNGENITDAWIKVGCNEGGDGSGFGEHFAADGDMEQMAMAQFAWDDDVSGESDFDYNDFIGRMRISEVRNTNNEMVMMFMTAKALARGSTNIADWQFNVGASFPGADEVYALVTQYHADGTQAAPQTVWQSTGGTSFPVFAPTSDAFPGAGPEDMVNVTSGEFIDGDYAEVIVILNTPQAQGSYTPIPYEPELYVTYGVDGNGDPLVETIPMWNKIGDELREDGFPQAFIVPDTYAYAMEGSNLATVYPEFWSATDHNWIDWINGQPPEPAPPWWQYPPVPDSGYFNYNLYFSN